jgi:hypothetical protein
MADCEKHTFCEKKRETWKTRKTGRKLRVKGEWNKHNRDGEEECKMLKRHTRGMEGKKRKYTTHDILI